MGDAAHAVTRCSEATHSARAQESAIQTTPVIYAHRIHRLTSHLITLTIWVLHSNALHALIWSCPCDKSSLAFGFGTAPPTQLCRGCFLVFFEL